MILSQRDIDVLRILCWCQYVPADLPPAIVSEGELSNLLALGLIKLHAKSGALVPTRKAAALLQDILAGGLPDLTRSYHPDAIRRCLRLSRVTTTFYLSGADPFLLSPEELTRSPSLFLSSITRGRGRNPWGSTRIAGVAHIGCVALAVHYVCPGIGRLVLNNELTTFSNQSGAISAPSRGMLFAGKTYADILTELEQEVLKEDGNKAINYANAYRTVSMPIYLLPCDSVGAVQLRIMAQPEYRRRLTSVLLDGQYSPPPSDGFPYDALSHGQPFMLAVDMDLRRVTDAYHATQSEGYDRLSIAALPGQIGSGVFKPYYANGRAKLYAIRDDILDSLFGFHTPYAPSAEQYKTPKGDVILAPPFQATGKTGR